MGWVGLGWVEWWIQSTGHAFLTPVYRCCSGSEVALAAHRKVEEIKK